MARIDNLSNFLKDVADAIRSKTGGTDNITPANFDTEIENIPSGGTFDWDEYRGNDTAAAVNRSLFSRIMKKVVPLKNNELTNSALSYCFVQCVSLTDISECNNWDTSLCTTASNTFNGCSSLVDISPLSSWRLQACEETNHMFYGCTKLKNIDVVNNWNIEHVITANYMFYNCQALTNVDWSGVKLRYLGPAAYMFKGCSNLTTIKFGDGTTGEVYSSPQLNYMFSECSKLKVADLSGFKPGMSVNKLQYMFYMCSSLEIVDIRNLKCSGISNSSYYQSALYGVPTTCKVIVKDTTEKNWWTTKFSGWASCFYTLEEAIAAGIVEN